MYFIIHPVVFIIDVEQMHVCIQGTQVKYYFKFNLSVYSIGINATTP